MNGVGLNGPSGVPVGINNIPELKDIHVSRCRCEARGYASIGIIYIYVSPFYMSILTSLEVCGA